jgi:hypothetical protein
MAGMLRERTKKFANETNYLLQGLKTKGKNNIVEKENQALYYILCG